MNQTIGASVPRKEDRRFLTGGGRFTDDINFAGQAYGIFVRADNPHACIRGIEAAAARQSDGVLLVLTADDIADEIIGPLPSFTTTPPFDLTGRDGRHAFDASQPPLARDKLRYLGEPVALVVAESLAQARDAADLVTIDGETLEAITGYDQALAPEAGLVWEEHGSNLSIDWENGDGAAVDKALAEAARTVDIELVNNRIVANFLEPRAVLADYDERAAAFTLYAGCQSAHAIKFGLPAVLDLKGATLRVIAPDTGGGFGSRMGLYPEYPVLLAAARRLARPVKWTATRSEGMVSDLQARDHRLRGRLALDKAGRMTALKVEADWRHGAYLPGRSVFVMVHYFVPMLTGAYRIPALHVRLRGLFSNTTPVAAYRGVGRMEANYLLESLIDRAALESGIDRVELRRRNLIPARAMPWTSPSGSTITSGAFARVLERALELADWSGFPKRRRQAATRGLRRGIGLGMYVENDGSTPSEFAEVVARRDGGVTVYAGTQDFGMGHATIYSQIIAEELGLPMDDIEVVYGDTDRVRRGAGSHGSRSARMGGSAVLLGGRQMIDNGRERAGELMEAAAADIEFSDGCYRITGTDRRVSLAAVAEDFEARGLTLAGEADFEVGAEVHANGCQISEVSIDPADGSLTIKRHIAVADVGRAINPMIVAGQLHGGAAQGIGQAALEQVVYDPESGQTLSGSLMDYTLPRAGHLSNFTIELDEIFEADNPIGAKGVGESAATGAPAAVMNAIRDALGGGPIDMPATAEKIWRAAKEMEAK